MSFVREGMWEGLGGPIRIDRPNLEDIDPALDLDLQLEEESNRRAAVLRRALQRHDVVAEKERQRRNLVTLPQALFSEYQCYDDPNTDGGEYCALIELREKRRSQEEQSHHDYQDGKNDEKTDDRGVSDASDDEFDYLLDEDLSTYPEKEELKLLEERRRAELEYEIWKREVALQNGYGVVRQIHPSRLFRAAGLTPATQDPPMAVVIHLVDPNSLLSASLDIHLERLAASIAKGTKFMRSGGRMTLLVDSRSASTNLPSLKDRDIPALVTVRDGVVVNVCPGLAGLACSNSGEIIPDAVTDWLDRSGVLLHTVPNLDYMCRTRISEFSTDSLLIHKTAIHEKKYEDETVPYNCGVSGCNKAFYHEHIGVHTKQQRGLLVTKEEVLGEMEK